MSVRTEADEKLDEVCELVDQAMPRLADLVYRKPWGWEDFKRERREDFAEALELLRKVDQKLRGE